MPDESDFDAAGAADRPLETGPTVCHGVDLVSIDRLAALLAEYGDSFRDRVFTESEQAYCEQQADPPQHYAARWAAKEAFLKTLGEASPGVPTVAIEVVRHPDGPSLSLSPVAREALDATLDARDAEPASADVAVSLSHDQTVAYAIGSVTVVASRTDDSGR